MPFTKETMHFLAENRLRDSREWYNEHKELYKWAVVAPMAELVKALTPDMLKIDPQFIVDPRVDRTISRIYRDTRFSHDKSLYRDYCWLIFIRDRKNMGLPAYYFEVSPTGFGYGMGYYTTPVPVMNEMRQMILIEEVPAVRALDAFRNQDIFHMEGDVYKRSKYKDQSEERKEWLDKKNISFNTHSKDVELLFSDRLTEVLIEGYRKLIPIYNFFCLAESRTRHDV